MENDIERRLEEVIERRRARAAACETGGNDASHERRQAHSRLLVELPRVSARIANAVGQLNDRLYDSGLSLKLDLVDHTPIAEAIYEIGVVGGDDGPKLVVTVDYTGAIRCMLSADGHRTLIGSYDVQTLDSPHLTEMLVQLLETHAR